MAAIPASTAAPTTAIRIFFFRATPSRLISKLLLPSPNRLRPGYGGSRLERLKVRAIFALFRPLQPIFAIGVPFVPQKFWSLKSLMNRALPDLPSGLSGESHARSRDSSSQSRTTSWTSSGPRRLPWRHFVSCQHPASSIRHSAIARACIPAPVPGSPYSPSTNPGKNPVNHGTYVTRRTATARMPRKGSAARYTSGSGRRKRYEARKRFIPTGGVR